MSDRDSRVDWSGRSVILRNKETSEEAHGIIIEDPPDGFTQIRINDGREVSAKDWLWKPED